MTAPTYSERLSGLAKQIGLGRGHRASREGPEPVTSEIPPQSRIAAAGEAAIMGRRLCGKHPQHHQDIGAPSRYRARAIGYPSLSAMKPVMRNSGRGRADERDRIAASLSGWYNQLHLLFNHLFLVFSVR